MREINWDFVIEIALGVFIGGLAIIFVLALPSFSVVQRFFNRTDWVEILVLFGLPLLFAIYSLIDFWLTT